MGIIDEFMDGFLERLGANELTDRYVSGIYEMLEGVYARGVKDGQEENRDSFQDHIDEAEAEGYSEGHADGYKEGNKEVDVDIYKTGYMLGFDDASHGRPTKVKDEFCHFAGLLIDLDDKKEDK